MQRVIDVHGVVSRCESLCSFTQWIKGVDLPMNQSVKAKYPAVKKQAVALEVVWCHMGEPPILPTLAPQDPDGQR